MCESVRERVCVHLWQGSSYTVCTPVCLFVCCVCVCVCVCVFVCVLMAKPERLRLSADSYLNGRLTPTQIPEDESRSLGFI